MLFKDYARLYLDTAPLALSTRGSYAAALTHYWLPYLGEHAVTDIRYATLLEIDHRITWPSAKTRKNAHAPLRGVFALAYLDNGLPEVSSPAHKIKLGRHQREQPDPFTREERDAIMHWMHGRPQGLYFRTAFATGMRSGELIALEWSQYDGESLRVHQSRVRGKRKDTKTHRERRVYLPAWLTGELNAHWTRSEGGAIFLNRYGRPYQKPDKLNRVFRRCLAELNIRPRRGPYPWRHTYASIGISAGAEPAFLARQLGHALETFYGTYAQWLSHNQDRTQRAIVDQTWSLD